MGLILPQTVSIRTNGSNCKYFREKGYEFEKCGDFIEVNVLDLKKGSGTKVKIICDICGKEAETWYSTVVKYNKKNELITCGSKSCINKKREDTCMEKYGVKYAAQSQEVQNKMKATNLERYGAENPFGSKEIRDKIKDTWQKNYGENITNPFQAEEVREKIRATWQKNYGENITNPFQTEEVRDKTKATLQKNYGEGIVNISQVKEIRDKIKDTNLGRYGAECPFGSKEIQDKIKATFKKRYGVDNPMKNEEIKNKALDSFQFNGTGPCSRAQKYIHFLIGGALNKRICNSLVDICFEEEKTAIEYDGGGHFLGELIVNKDRFISKEAFLKEKNREYSIVNKGYKVIRFIATKDRIPSDEVILNLINEFKNSDFKVIRINFEEGTIEKDYKEKSHRIFGELRKITQKDLEQFESKKQ